LWRLVWTPRLPFRDGELQIPYPNPPKIPFIKLGIRWVRMEGFAPSSAINWNDADDNTG
jgi:hypothetical protein